MKLFLFPNYTKPKTASVVRQILDWAERRQVAVDMEEQDARDAEAGWPAQSASAAPDALAGHDVILAVGGDGTVIRAAHSTLGSGLPLAGVNTGTLGFLAQISLDNLEDRLEQLRGGHFSVERRKALKAEWPGGEIPFALNDIVLQRRELGGLVHLHICNGKELVGRYRSDGLVISTATGSTAYAYATGGPIVDPSLDALVIAPICPQNRMNIPLICGMERPVLVSALNGPVRILADGVDQGLVSSNTVIRVCRSDRSIPMVRFGPEWGVLEWQRRISLL